MAHGDQDFVGAVGCKSLSFPKKKTPMAMMSCNKNNNNDNNNDNNNNDNNNNDNNINI